MKRLVADQALDNQILREAARPNWRAPSEDVGPWQRSAVAWAATGVGTSVLPGLGPVAFYAALPAQQPDDDRRLIDESASVV